MNESIEMGVFRPSKWLFSIRPPMASCHGARQPEPQRIGRFMAFLQHL
jgi:hypothetical protein